MNIKDQQENYFSRLLHLLKIEKETDRRTYEEVIRNLSVSERRAAGLTWFPVAIKDSEVGRGDYLIVEVERTSNADLIHQLRFGMTAALFSNHDAKYDRVEGTISYISGNKLRLSLRTDELPDWTRNGKLGIDAVFDENSYTEMENALKQAASTSEKKDEGRLVRILTGSEKTSEDNDPVFSMPAGLNRVQEFAVQKILGANEIAIVHGPPGTGKTTTLVAAIRAMVNLHHQQILVTAPSNTAVDLLSEKLSAQGLQVVRVGNPAKVSERLMELTLDSKCSRHPAMKEMKKLKKQAAEYHEMARKYKRNFGAAEREQRKALFAEARNIAREVERTEQYIMDDVLAKAEVITATLVGANHYSVRKLRYQTVVIDEAGQSIEPACWIPVLKGEKVVMAGDHCQLPPTIKSEEAARNGLAETLMEKLVKLHPASVVLLEEQYRMHRTIMGFSSKEFYEGRLKAHHSVAEHLLFPEDKPLLFIDTAGCGFEEKREGTSISNPEEAAFTIQHLVQTIDRLKSQGGETELPSIAVISPYKHQVEILKELLASNADVSGGLVSVNTIDSFQGQERDMVYISLTRSNADNIIGFLSEVRRMNVAMTRARKKLVVIGDSSTLSQFPFYEDFIRYAQEMDGYVSAWEYMGDS